MKDSVKSRFETRCFFVPGNVSEATEGLKEKLNEIGDCWKLISHSMIDAAIRKEGTTGERIEDREFGIAWTIVVEFVPPEALHGWIVYGPDGEWWWTPEFKPTEGTEDWRPATSLEKAILRSAGGSTEKIRAVFGEPPQEEEKEKTE